MAQEDWFRSAFSDDYIRIYAHRDQKEARAAIRQLTKRLPVYPQGLYLDLCCGFARHLDYLNSIGLSSVGCDLSMDLLTRAPGSMGNRLVQANMLTLPFQSSAFDGVFSFFTSFGYFENDSDNARVIHEMARVLKPGGHLVIDFLNPYLIQDTLVPKDDAELDGFHLSQERWIDSGSNTVNKKMTVTEDGEQRVYYERVKLYDLEMFTQFFLDVGLDLKETLGDTSGTPYGKTSERLILIAEKP